MSIINRVAHILYLTALGLRALACARKSRRAQQPCLLRCRQVFPCQATTSIQRAWRRSGGEPTAPRAALRALRLGRMLDCSLALSWRSLEENKVFEVALAKHYLDADRCVYSAQIKASLHVAAVLTQAEYHAALQV